MNINKYFFSIFLIVFCSAMAVQAQNTVEVRPSKDYFHIRIELEKNSLFKVSYISGKDRIIIGTPRFLTSGDHGFKIKKEVVKSNKILFTITSYDYDFVKIFGSFGSGMGNFFHPVGITKDRLDRLYIADSNNDRIQVMNKNGGYITEFGVFDWAEKDIFDNQDGENFESDSDFIDSGANLNNPVGLSVGQFLYVVDKGNNRIVKFNNDYSFLKYFGKYGNDRLEFIDINNITMDDNENIYIVDSGNDRIVKTDSNGRFIFELGSFGRGLENFNNPQDICVDLNRNIYVADAGNKKVKVFDEQGLFKYEFSCKTLKGMDFIYSWKETLFLIDSNSKLIYLTNLKGRRFMKIAHNKFGRPESCVILDDKYLFVTDSETNNIRIFEIKCEEETFTREISESVYEEE
ncbi:NHL repeat-containing protein [bacterium]|nr:NHL repeat-containing protein [bacterium]